MILNENEIKKLENVEKCIKCFAEIVRKYGSDFCLISRLIDVTHCVETICTTMLDYPGMAKRDLPSLRSELANIVRAYENCINPVFELSVSVGGTFDAFVAHATSQDLPSGDREALWTMAAHSLSNGLVNLSKALDSLYILKGHTDRLGVLLHRLLKDIDADYAINGQCTRVTADLSARNRTVLEERHQHLNYLKNVSKTILGKRKELADRLLPILEYIFQPETITSDIQIKKFKDCFNILNNEITNARKVLNEAVTNLQNEKKDIEYLERLKFNPRDFSRLVVQASSEQQNQLISAIRTLRRECHSYKSLQIRTI